MVLPTSLLSYSSEESLFLEKLLQEYRRSNCFNPSLIFFDDHIIISFRAYQSGKLKPFHAYLLIFNKNGCSARIINLSNHYSNYGVDIVSDPKLSILNDQVWISFNTGYSQKANNMYIAQVFPELGPPYLCHYPSRRPIEKNWSFFMEEGTIKALYSISPVSVLTATEPVKTNRNIFFTEQFICNQDDDSRGLQYLTIGTQASMSNGHFYLMAHEKKYLLGRRMYLGVPVRILKKDSRYIQTISGKRFVHSYWSMLGSLKKHNPNLWSCTYFSGLQIKADGKVILAYGINDLNYAFREIRFDELWGPDN